jgi:hypothetical protein
MPKYSVQRIRIRQRLMKRESQTASEVIQIKLSHKTVRRILECVFCNI